MFENSKSAPASTVFKELLEGKKITEEQQMQVIENRREILVRCMKTFSQKTLGQLACLDSGDGFVHELCKDDPRVVSLDNKFSLDSRGFFAGNSFTIKKGGERLAFGIDEESWLLIRISYLKKERDRTWPHENEVARTVQVTRTDLRTIIDEIEVSPRLIWNYFNMITNDWVSHRKSQYDQAYRVAEGMKMEDTIFQLIT